MVGHPGTAGRPAAGDCTRSALLAGARTLAGQVLATGPEILLQALTQSWLVRGEL
jgi:hypothetical protein